MDTSTDNTLNPPRPRTRDHHSNGAAPESFVATRVGEDKLVDWLASFGSLGRVGVEGTGSYGAGLARRLAAAGVDVVEVDRPNRQLRRRQGKTDTLDAIEAARAALSGRAVGRAKSRDGNVEAIGALVVAKRSARSTKTKSLNQIRHLGYTAPEPLRERLSGLTAAQVAIEAASLRPRPGTDPVTFATKTSLRILGRRVLALDAELGELDALLTVLVTATAPALLELHGIGVHTAALLLVSAGDNPQRLRSEAAWAHLCGVSPIQASSGKITRHRLNRSGDRQANHALWRIALTRMSSDPRTRVYIERRTAEGKTKLEIVRILKRYIAREIYPLLPRTRPDPSGGPDPPSTGRRQRCLTNDLSARRSPPPPRRQTRDDFIRAWPRPHRVPHPRPVTLTATTQQGAP